MSRKRGDVPTGARAWGHNVMRVVDSPNGAVLATEATFKERRQTKKGRLSFWSYFVDLFYMMLQVLLDISGMFKGHRSLEVSSNLQM